GAGVQLRDEPGPSHPVPDDDHNPPSAPLLWPITEKLTWIRGHRILSSRAAHTLNSGIRDVGSSASSVAELARAAPAQWNGTNSVSGRMVSTTLAGASMTP